MSSWGRQNFLGTPRTLTIHDVDRYFDLWLMKDGGPGQRETRSRPAGARDSVIDTLRGQTFSHADFLMVVKSCGLLG